MRWRSRIRAASAGQSILKAPGSSSGNPRPAANLGWVSATADDKLEAANWNLEPLVDDRGPEAVEQMLTEARERAGRFAEAYRGRVTELDSAELAEAMRELAEIHDLGG